MLKLTLGVREGCARRTCARWSAAHFIRDSDEYWGEAEPERWTCIDCGCETCNLTVGFSLRRREAGQAPDVRWIAVGVRCTVCGVLASFVDWKVNGGPSHHLLEQA